MLVQNLPAISRMFSMFKNVWQWSCLFIIIISRSNLHLFYFDNDKYDTLPINVDSSIVNIRMIRVNIIVTVA